jgi:hypothetical protein
LPEEFRVSFSPTQEYKLSWNCSTMIPRIIIAIISIALLLINSRLYYNHTGSMELTDEHALRQLRFLDDEISNGADHDMQKSYPEGFFFLNVLHGLSWAEIARGRSNPPELRQRALQQARHALQQLESPQGRRPFPADLEPPYGIFYNGWKTWLHGKIVAAQEEDSRDTAEAERFIASCEALADAFDHSGTPFLQSYHDAAWPSDALLAIAALRLHDQMFTPRFTRTIARWIVEVRQRLDPATGLLPHRVDPVTGYPVESARGSSQSLMLRFLAEVDPGFARSQYALYRSTFVSSWLGLPGIREYPHGIEGDGDVDSGPVGFGIGASATIVGLGTARMFDDSALAGPLDATIETVGLPVDYGNSKRYLFGLVPVGDAFLVWSRLARPYSLVESTPPHEPMLHWWWRLPFHGVSALVIVVMWLPVWRVKYRMKRIAGKR